MGTGRFDDAGARMPKLRTVFGIVLALVLVVVFFPLNKFVVWLESNSCSTREPNSSAFGTTRQQHDLSSILPSSDADLELFSCSVWMDRFHRLNQAYRNSNILLDGESASVNRTTVAKPLINYAFYRGQGFGRVVEHTTLHCIFALALDRPCVIMMDDRDPYFTWRTFLWRGSYDWEFTGSPAEWYKPNLERLVETTLSNHKTQPQVANINKDRFEMKGKPEELKLIRKPVTESSTAVREESSFWADIAQWRPEHEPYPLLSPNWGNAWFDHIVFPAKMGACPLSELKSRMQHALYQPSPLTHKLFVERKEEHLSIGRQHPSQTSYPYGAIHIRTEILQLGKNLWTKFPTVLSNFVQTVMTNASVPNVSDWWIVADTPATAVLMTQQLRILCGNTSVRFLHSYSEQEETSNQLRDHSFSDDVRGLFQHAKMASSILDWMVLWQSSVAVVTVGAYGNTGAQGNNKIARLEKYKTLRAYW